MAIRNLATHSAQYVTVAELAEYWAVSRQQIYIRIESGALNAIRLGTRLYRIRTQAALEFERRASLPGTTAGEADASHPAPTPEPGQSVAPLPKKVGLQRVRPFVPNP